MSTTRLSALSNLGEIIMGNWRIILESGGFRYSVCAYVLSTGIFYGFKACEFLALFLTGIRLSPILLTFLLFLPNLLWVITLLLMLEGHHIAFLFYSPLIQI